MAAHILGTVERATYTDDISIGLALYIKLVRYLEQKDSHEIAAYRCLG